ncbi:F-box/FBD/LRR-repeat protein At3g14710-like [Coffea eugenioides]|uniref:F-box/FBD/LRR-repeat protein At3g14710-like n=1 Tax=Coffea eugenioides TaxID=49369 RepID=UPI000F60E221|nr:F-box/FBD/LRR-repeat protein At3g14710-like [Coffea eugenioides]
MDKKRSRSKELLDSKKDRISELPESVLSHILSRLPTEDAVRTSVLSRKWEYKWTSIYNLTFDDRKRFRYSHRWRKWKVQKQPKKTDFMNFVDRVLALSKNSSIKECHLLFLDVYDPFRMKTWITAALSSNVQRLLISYAADLVLPRWFFTSDSLMNLELKLCKIKIPMNISYSNLRILDIHGVEFQNDESLQSSHLVFTFPVLEEFLSSGCKWWNMKLLEIKAPRLARFEMTDSSFECVNDGPNDCKIEVRGGNLAKLKCGVDKFANFYFSSTSTIVDASLHYSEPYTIDDLKLRMETSFRACMILRQVSAFIRSLELSTDLVQVLSHRYPSCRLPFFYKLTHLKVYSARMAIECDAALIDFLKEVPFLESLLFTGQYSSKAAGNNDGIELMSGNFLCCLKVVKIEYSSYFPSPVESHLAKFLLRNAVRLKEFLIYQEHKRHEADQVKNKLLNCSRGSSHVFILCI